MTAFVFWVSLFLMFMVYAGYPALIKVLAILLKRKVIQGDSTPGITIVISAYNEEEHIGATLENKLRQNYPKERMEIIVVSDGSTDRTEAIVRNYAGNGVQLIVQGQRQGKTAALNRAVAQARGEIIVFSDANSIYDADAVRNLVQNFADPQVGYVTGKMVYVDESGSVIGDGCSAYMKYENVLRTLETKVGSIVGVDGGIDAVRKSLYEPMEASLLPDFVLPLRVVEKGYRVVYNDRALLKEQTLKETTDELRMRMRVALRSFHALWHMKRLFNPFRYGLFPVELFMHKLLRYMVGYLQLAAFVTNLILAPSSQVYSALFLGQIVFYGLAFGGLALKRSTVSLRVATYSYYICLLNWASAVAFFKFINGEKQIIWQPRKG